MEMAETNFSPMGKNIYKNSMSQKKYNNLHLDAN